MSTMQNLKAAELQFRDLMYHEVDRKCLYLSTTLKETPAVKPTFGDSVQEALRLKRPEYRERNFHALFSSLGMEGIVKVVEGMYDAIEPHRAEVNTVLQKDMTLEDAEFLKKKLLDPFTKTQMKGVKELANVNDGLPRKYPWLRSAIPDYEAMLVGKREIVDETTNGRPREELGYRPAMRNHIYQWSNIHAQVRTLEGELHKGFV